MDVQDGLSLKQSVSYQKLSMATGNIMGGFTTGDRMIDSVN